MEKNVREVHEVAATYIRGRLGYSIEYCLAKEIYELIYELIF